MNIFQKYLTKKPLAWTFLALMTTLLTFLIVSFLTNQEMKLHNNNMTNKVSYYQIIDLEGFEEIPTISLSRESSDLSFFSAILNTLIGTLVKYGISGKIEPYLAESFSQSDDKLRWEFKLRENLICEDGSKITAESFVKKITNSLRQYSQKKKVADFEFLKGWDDFIAEKTTTIAGLSSKENSVLFEFLHPSDDLLNFLRMPYFGYWCDNTNTPNKILSSASYQIYKFEQPNSLVVKKRNNWFANDLKGPEFVEFKISEVTEAITNKNPTIIQINDSTDLDINSFNVLKTPPFWHMAFVLGGKASGVFQNKRNRLAFQHHFNQIAKDLDFFNSSSIFPLIENNETIPEFEFENTFKDQTMTVAFQASSHTHAEKSIILNTLNTIFKNRNIKLKIVIGNFSDKNWLKRVFSNSEFDIRVAGVSVAGVPDLATSRMMFCTKLGVTFPDPDHGICNLLNSYTKTNQLPDSSFVRKFHKILRDNAAVIPFRHYSRHTLISKDIDPTTVPPAGVYPSFEKIRFLNEL